MRGPHEQVTIGAEVAYGPQEIRRRYRLFVDCLQCRLGDFTEPISSRIPVLAEVAVLAHQQVVFHVVRAHRFAGFEGDRAGQLEEAFDADHVDGHDTVDILARSCLPHLGRRCGGRVETGRQIDVAPFPPGLENTPDGLHVAVDTLDRRREHQILGRGEITRIEGAVLHFELGRLQVHSRTRPHLSVVRSQQQVVGRSGQELVHTDHCSQR